MLDTYERELVAGRRRAAYEAVLAVWRARRTPELAELVERAAIAFGPAEPLAAKTQKALVEAWLARARTREPYEGRWLLEQLEPLVNAHKGSIVAACLDELLATSDDPSLTLTACRLVALPGGTVNFGSWGKVLTRLFKLVGQSGDVRAVAALEVAAKPDDKRTPSTNQLLADRIPKVAAKLREIPVATLDDAERAAVKRALARLAAPLPDAVAEPRATTNADTLFAAVLADPNDDKAIAVWGDALQQQGDARGELVALQLAGDNAAATKAATKLVARHWRQWLGAIAPAIVPSSVVFERGLFVACTTDVRRKGVADAVFANPAWATIRRIHFLGYGHPTAVMTRIEEATGVSGETIERFAAHDLRCLRALSIRDLFPRSAAKALVGAKLFALRVLGLPVFNPEQLAWLPSTSLASQLETIRIEGPAEIRSFAPWLEPLQGMTALREIVFDLKPEVVVSLAERSVTLRRPASTSWSEARHASLRTTLPQVAATARMRFVAD